MGLVVLGLILLVIGLLLPKFAILVTIGVVVLIVGLILVALRVSGRPLGGGTRRYWWY
jgi:hypothetical protein